MLQLTLCRFTRNFLQIAISTSPDCQPEAPVSHSPVAADGDCSPETASPCLPPSKGAIPQHDHEDNKRVDNAEVNAPSDGQGAGSVARVAEVSHPVITHTQPAPAPVVPGPAPAPVPDPAPGVMPVATKETAAVICMDQLALPPPSQPTPPVKAGRAPAAAGAPIPLTAEERTALTAMCASEPEQLAAELDYRMPLLAMGAPALAGKGEDEQLKCKVRRWYM